MAIKTLLRELHARDVKLWVEEDELRFRAPKGALTPALHTELREHKTEIVTFLHQAQNHRQPTTMQPVVRPTQIPLSLAQERMWMLDQLGLHSAYNIPMALHIEGDLQIDALAQTLTELVRRHEILRTTVALNANAMHAHHAHGAIEDNGQRTDSQAGMAYQVIHDAPAADVTVDLPIVDLRHLVGAAQQAAEIQRMFEAEIARPFDLTADLMLRATLFQLADQTYRLLLIVHHFASDGWSQNIMLQEAATLYRAFVQGEDHGASLLPALPLQYADFALQQREQLTPSWIEAELRYWRKQLVSMPQQLQLPTDRPRPQTPSFAGHTHRFVIEAELVHRLRQLSRGAETTLFTTLLTAFQLLLARYTGETDIVVGTISDNRNQQALEPLIGLFINTLILRANLAGNPSFRTLLSQAKVTTEEAYSHQALPFAYLVDALQAERTLAYHPLAQLFFRLRRQPTTEFDLPGVQVSRFEFDFNRKGLPDLDLMLEETDQQINGYCFYNSELFDRATIERLIAHYKTLLAVLVANPEQPVYTLPLLTAAEQQQQLVTWNDRPPHASMTWPATACVHQLFEEQVARTPHAPAVIESSEASTSLTYIELNRRANQLAHYLRQCGVGPDTLVGICLERSPTMVIALLATLKAGGAYVPLDPAYPQERLALMIADSQLTVLLVGANTLISQSGHGPQIVNLVEQWSVLQAQPDHNPDVAVGPDNLVYAIYTSGSTGEPKGAAVYHRGFTNLLHWYVNELGMTVRDRVLLITALSFDLTQKNLFAPLLCGGALYLAEALFDPDVLCHIVDRHAISWINCTPSMFAFLVEADLRHAPLRLTPLRTVVLGGEPIALQQFTDWLARPEIHVTLVNSYGPTECTDVSAAYVLQNPATFSDSSVPIGRPIPNVQLYVLDRHMQPVPVGHIGELCIAGVGVGAGYLHRPAQTAAAFLANPFATVDAGQANGAPHFRLYKTGDLVRYLPDGNLKFVGRIDSQVKVRGFRIEPGEIEATLVEHPALRAAAVTVRTAEPGTQQLVAYVVAEENGLSAPLQPDVLRSFLGDRLPDYMVPSHFVQLDELPLTLSGKIDRSALSGFEYHQSASTIQPASPTPARRATSQTDATTPAPQSIEDAPVNLPVDALLEQEIATAWAQILGQRDIGATDNFFARGGDSFLAIRCVALLTERGLPLTLRDLFAAPTVAGVAARLQARCTSEELNNFYARHAQNRQTIHQHAHPNTQQNGEVPDPSSGEQAAASAVADALPTPLPTPLPGQSPLVPIQPNGAKPPFFCIHPVMGGVHPYYPLAHLLGDDIPFYGLRAISDERSQPRHTTIEALAAYYIQALRTVQPEGPYALGGWSFGGWVAFEMAQQLLAQGDSVNALIIIDTPALSQKRTLWDHLRSLWEFGSILGRYIWPYVSDRDNLAIAMADFIEDDAEAGDEPAVSLSAPASSSRPALLRHPAMRHGWRMFMAHNRATFTYAPHSYAGKITVLRAANQPKYDVMDLGWGQFAEQGVEIKTITGDHMTVLRQPHVQTVADCIRTVLTQNASTQASAASARPHVPANRGTQQSGHKPTPPVADLRSAAAQPVTQPHNGLPQNRHTGSNGNGVSAHTETLPPRNRKAPASPRPVSATAAPAATATAHRQRPQNGQEYLASLRDGREVWIYGKRVADVTAHPAFRNQSRMIARLYDALHDPAQQSLLTCATDNGSGGYTHPFFRASRTVAELTAARDALAAWHRIGYGWMGRGPDYMAGALGMLGPNADFYAPYQANAQRWYQQFQSEMPYVCHAISNPPVDRHRPPDELEDVYIHVVKETDAGIIVSGAKNITTNSALSQYAFVGQDGGAHVRSKSFATTFLIAMNTPGIKILCRPSYEMTAAVMGTPFDYPLSSRLDENDAILIFDEVLVPWENVLVYGDLEKQNQHIARTGFFPRSGLQSSTRLAVKFDLIAGLLLKAVEATGVNEFRGVQVNVGEVLTWRHLFWGLSDAMAHTAVEHNGAVIPKIEHMMAHRMLMSVAYPRIKEITSQLVASGLIFQPSSALDFKTAELRPYLEKYVRGAAGDAEERVKLMKTLWDAIGTEFAGRHELYERNNLGNHEAVRLHALFHSVGTGTEETLKQFAEICMGEVDLEGWTADDLINPDDLHGFHAWVG